MEITVKNADEYFSSRLNTEDWFDLTEAEKQSAITTAEDKINSLPFIGTQAAPNQEKPFPRYYKYELLNTPNDVVKAIFEEAYSLIVKSDLAQTELPQGVSSISLGSASISFNQNAKTVTDNLTQNAQNYLEKWLKKGFDAEEASFREVY